MNKISRKFSLPTALSLLFLIAFSTTSCIRQEVSQAESVKPKAPANAAENAEIRNAREIIEKMPDAALGYNKLAVAYLRQARQTGDFSLNNKAESALARALELDVDNFEANKIKASLLLTLHRFAEALALGTSLQEKHPADAFFYGVLTDANVELGKYDDALKNVQKMVDMRPDMSSYARVSHVRSLYGDSAGAIEAMTNAARIADPMDKEAQAWCLVRLGEEFFKTGAYDKAEKQFDDALEIFPDFYIALAAKGKARAAAGDFENAVKFLETAQKRVPLPETVIALGNIYAKTGDAEKAAEQYELAELIEKSAGNEDRRRLALLWADRNQNLGEALGIARREYETRRDIYTADILAWCLYKNGDFEEARKIITEAMRLKTKDAQIFYHAGMIEKELGNRQKARQFLQKALELSPKFDVLQAEKAKTAFDSLS